MKYTKSKSKVFCASCNRIHSVENYGLFIIKGCPDCGSTRLELKYCADEDVDTESGD